MTRSNKANNKDHAGLAEGTVLPIENAPKFFSKNGFEGVDPKKTKKNGGGRGNWGGPYEEVIDDDFTFNHSRRRSNSFSASHHMDHFKTKFEINELEPVFDQDLHGPADEDDVEALTKTETSSSGGSVDDNKEHQ